jgi:hypothetical protein
MMYVVDEWQSSERQAHGTLGILLHIVYGAVSSGGTVCTDLFSVDKKLS